MVKIYPISAFQDNYIWVIVCDKLKQAIVVDPGDAKPALHFLQENKLNLAAIFVTHKHHDHMGGVAELLSVYKNTPVFSHQTDHVLLTTNFVDEKNIIKINQWPCEFKVIEIPGHTLGHIAFYSKPHLFCGDTLFAGGCGRIFEGTAAQMLASLKKLSALPDDTLMYCGHEYTVKNLEFALCVDENNLALKNRYKQAKIIRENKKPTLPSTISLENATNPFLRCHIKSIKEKIESQLQCVLSTETEVFEKMREWKNRF